MLGTLPERSVDVIFADPPYNLQLQQELHRPNLSRVDAVDAAWDQFSDFAAYDAFSVAWLNACRRVLKDDGGLWVIGSYHNIYRVGTQVQNLGFWILNDVIWVKRNPMPNFRGVRLTNAHETLLWCAKSPNGRPAFNYHGLKAGNEDRQLRSDWEIPICSGNERLMIAGKKLHPTQKPEALLQRVLMMSSRPGDVVLDPFFGTGTSGAVAKRLGRRFIGIERDETYAAAAQQRIDAVVPLDDPSLIVPDGGRRAAPRIPLLSLIEHGLLRVGQSLFFDGDPARSALILADGSIRNNADVRGSIHRVGAATAGLSACNGWERWQYHDEHGVNRPIDALREQLRRRIADG
ncbi:MAG: site-specific DNA-methyltransferase [Oscillochloris sp.]|nr:site-specific DNA-methyltransferase [Oscillochloris sp.]